MCVCAARFVSLSLILCSLLCFNHIRHINIPTHGKSRTLDLVLPLSPEPNTHLTKEDVSTVTQGCQVVLNEYKKAESEQKTRK